MNPTLRPHLRWLASILGLALGATACDQSSTGPGQVTAPPDPPAAATMDVDFALFSGANPTAPADAPSGILAAPSASGVNGVGLHFVTAGVTVAVAQAITVLHLAVPTAVFAAAANNTPSFEDDGLWHWRYSASHLGQLWTAHLSGRVEGNEVRWDMRITAPQANPPLEEFRWYAGDSRTDRTRGTWRFYDPRTPNGTTETVRIDWTHLGDLDRGVTITVVSGPNVGDVITADVDGNQRLVTFHDASLNRTVEIGWNAATGSGYIIAPNYNGGTRSCWDENQNDVACA